MKQKQIIEWSITEIVVSDPCLTPAGTGLILFTGAFKLKGDLSNNSMHFDSEGITQGVPDHLHATALRELAGMIAQTIKLYTPMISFLDARHLPEANGRTGGKKTKAH
jgi:hypothetical protein